MRRLGRLTETNLVKAGKNIFDAPVEYWLQPMTSKRRDSIHAPRSAITFLTLHNENLSVDLTPVARIALKTRRLTMKTFHGDEQLETWQDGPIGVGRISVEAVRYGSSVWALISLRDGAVGAGARPPKKDPQAGHEGELAF
jgi:hypothetical protein